MSKPKRDSRIVWKIAYSLDEGLNKKLCLIKLRIPRTAMVRPHWDVRSDKHRASKARVVEIRCLTTFRKIKFARAWWWRNSSSQFIYEVGKMVKPEFAFNRKIEFCGSGIHFFFSINEALRFAVERMTEWNIEATKITSEKREWCKRYAKRYNYRYHSAS